MSEKTDLGGEAPSGTSESEGSMNIIVKTSKERESFQIAVDADVKTLRQLVSERYQIEPSKVCLIFSGKILKDGDLLQNHKMKDGHIVHLVIRDVNKLPATGESSSQPRPTAVSTTSTTSSTFSSSTSPSATSTTSSNASANPFSNMFGSMFSQNSGGSAPGLEEFNQQFAQQLNNPEFMRQMLDNPLMQNIYSNPDIFRSIITSNPQFQSLIERNPELNHVLSNPEILRQTFDMMRNPAAFQELMRSHDRALSNLESLPGGYNALRRMYTEFQEPMLNAAQEQFGANSFASSNSSSTTTTTAPSNTENREPLPNPWDRSTTNATTNSSSQPLGTGSNPASAARPPASSPFNMFSSGAMQAAMEQFASNPAMVQNIMNSPLMQQMVQSLASDPNLANQLMSSAPGAPMPNSANLQSMLNSFSNSFSSNSNTIFSRIMNSPEAVQALISIQNNYQELERILGIRVDTLNMNEILRLFSSQGGISSANVSATSTAVTSASSAQTTTTASPQAGGQPNSTVSNSASNPVPNLPSLNAASLTQMMQQMFSVSQQQQQQQQQQPPEVRFQQQLTQLEQMGFTNREANIRALVETFGNVEAAIDRLLMRM